MRFCRGNDAKARIMRWIEKKGVRPCHDPEWTGLLLECIMPIGDVFPDIVRQVSAWYCYLILEQEGEAAEHDPDAIHWKMVAKDGKEVIYAIGISAEALEAGKEYAALVCLHELAHMLTNDDHTIRFHETLSRLINEFNAVTGSSIVDDFFGIETRYDSQPWILPDNIPQQQSRRGNQFRTEAMA